MADAQPTPGAKRTISPAANEPRARRAVVTGIVTRAQTDKTRRVEIQRLVRHSKYGKFVKRRTVCYTHDETNDSGLGDTVEIMECRPLSKMKRWRLVKVITRAPSRTLSGLEGAVAGSAVAEATGEAAAAEKKS